MKEAIEGIKVLYIAITNFKLYRRWSKIQYIKSERLRKQQELKEKEIWVSLEKKCNIEKFAIRRKPRLLSFYKKLRTLKRIVLKIFLFLLKFIGIIITIIIICHLFNWAAEHPMGIIIFLLIMILLKK